MAKSNPPQTQQLNNIWTQREIPAERNMRKPIKPNKRGGQKARPERIVNNDSNNGFTVLKTNGVTDSPETRIEVCKESHYDL